MNGEHGQSRSRSLVCIASSAETGTTPEEDLEAFGSALKTSLPRSSVLSPMGGCSATEGVAQRDGITAAIAGYPQWRHDALVDLAKELGHAEALLQAYIQHGERLLDHLYGAFTFTILDAATREALAAIDRLGQQQLYYSNESGIHWLASELGALSQPQQQRPAPSPQGVFNYTYFHMVPAPGSIYEGICKLQSGCLLKIKDGACTTARYWQPDFRRRAEPSFDSSKKELREVLKRSVARAMEGQTSVAAFLSGGLDSSSVSGMLAELTEGEAEAFSIGFSAEGYDEMAFARTTAKHFGMHLNEYYVTPEDVVNALPTIAASYPEPFGNSSALPAWFCAKMAADKGVQRLLAGDGGDELFAGNTRYARQLTFEHYEQAPAWLRSRVLEPVLAALPGSISLLNKANRYVEQARVPLPDRLQQYNFLHRHAPEEVFQAEFLATVNADEPIELLRSIYQAPEHASTLDRMLHMDWQITLADNDLRKVSGMCALSDIEVTYPMLDDELLAFSMTIPDHWKLKRNDLRHFYKESLRGWLPESTINKSKQGFGLPFGVWMSEHKPLQELAYDTLLGLRDQPYFNAAFLDKTIALHRDGHAAYYGELVWVLTVLGLWLKSHGSSKA